MIQAEEICRMVHWQPIQPLAVHLKDGRVIDICDESLAVIGTTFLTIGIPRPGQTDPFQLYERLEILELDEIERVEPRPGPAVATLK
jgi:hypothetical protein